MRAGAAHVLSGHTLVADGYHPAGWTEWQSFFSAMNQPSTDGVNTYLVSKAAAAIKLKVALSGLGGDELFGGYPSFRDVPRMQHLIPDAPRVGKALRIALAPFTHRITS